MQTATQPSQNSILSRAEAAFQRLSAKLNSVWVPSTEPTYNFHGHEAERFAFRLASSAGEYTKLEAIGFDSPEGRKLVTEMAKKQLEAERGLGYPEDPIAAALKISGLAPKLLENNCRMPDDSAFNGAKITNAFFEGASFKELAKIFASEAQRTLRATFLAREGSEQHGILALAMAETVERLAVSAGADLIAKVAAEADPSRRVALQLEVLKKAGLIERA